MRELPQLFNKPGFINLTPMVRGPGTKKGLGPRTKNSRGSKRSAPKNTPHSKGEGTRAAAGFHNQSHRGETAPGTPPGPRRYLSIPPRTPISLTGLFAPPTLTVQPRGHRAAGDPTPQETYHGRTSEPAPTLGPFISPPGLAACRPQLQLAACSESTDFGNYLSSTAPPLHRKHASHFPFPARQ